MREPVQTVGAWRLVRRETVSPLAPVAVGLAALVLTVVLMAPLMTLIGVPAGAAMATIFLEPFSGWAAISEVLLKAGPILLIAQGLAIGFRAGIINIGAEGQFVLGAIFASALPVWMPQSQALLWPAMLLLGALGGVLWAGIAAIWRTRLGASEMLVTLMLSFVAVQLLNWLLLGPWKDPMSFGFPQSVMFPPGAMLPVWPGTRLTPLLAIALAATLVAWWFMARSFAGYRLAVGGIAPRAARYAGFEAEAAVWIGLLCGGAAAGLAGAAEVAGPMGQLQRSVAQGYGYTAIVAAYLGGQHPLGVAAASLALAALAIGGDAAVVSAGMPAPAVALMQGLLLCCYLAALLFSRFRVERAGA